MARDLSRQIAQRAERLLEDWADDGAFDLAKIEPDVLGIDRKFELPSPVRLVGNVGLDALPADIRGHVQVKGSAKPVKRRKVKLTNWRRFVDDDTPCFFLGIQIGHRGAPLAAHLVHVDEAQVARVLERLRRLDIRDAETLQRHELEVEWTPDSRLVSPTAEAFVDRVRRDVGDPGTYAERKRRWRETVGYAERAHHLLVDLHATPEEVAEASVGNGVLRATVRAHTTVRFGIERDASPGLPKGPVLLSFGLKTRPPAELLVRGIGSPVVIKGEMLVPPNPSLPPAKRFVRFHSPELDLTFKGRDFSTIDIRQAGLAHTHRPIELRALSRAARAVRGLLHSSADAQMTIDGREFSLGPFTNGNPVHIDEVTRYSLCFEWAAIAATEAGVPDDVLVVPEDILDQVSRFAPWAAHLDTSVVSVQIAVKAPDYTAGSVAITWLAHARIGPYLVVQPLAFRDENPGRTEERVKLQARPWRRGPARRLALSDARRFDPIPPVVTLEQQLTDADAHVVIESHDSIREQWNEFVDAESADRVSDEKRHE